MNIKKSILALIGLMLTAAVASATPDPLTDLTGAVDSTIAIGTTVATVSVSLFLIAMAKRFFGKGAR